MMTVKINSLMHAMIFFPSLTHSNI